MASRNSQTNPFTALPFLLRIEWLGSQVYLSRKISAGAHVAFQHAETGCLNVTSRHIPSHPVKRCVFGSLRNVRMVAGDGALHSASKLTLQSSSAGTL